MFSYDHATAVMYTCDAFGMHYCNEEPFDTDVKAILPHYRCGSVRGVMPSMTWRLPCGRFESA